METATQTNLRLVPPTLLAVNQAVNRILQTDQLGSSTPEPMVGGLPPLTNVRNSGLTEKISASKANFIVKRSLAEHALGSNESCDESAADELENSINDIEGV